jgi:CheY-like chemotaxis protein
MHMLNLLLANSDRQVANLIESLVRDVCGDRSVLHCTRTVRVDELTEEGCRGSFDLIILGPEHLAPGPDRPAARISMREAVTAIRTIKNFRTVPMIATAVSGQNELALSEAGADLVLGLPFSCEQLKAGVRRLAPIPQEPPVLRESPLAAGWKRTLQRLAGSMAFSRTWLQ